MKENHSKLEQMNVSDHVHKHAIRVFSKDDFVSERKSGLISLVG